MTRFPVVAALLSAGCTCGDIGVKDREYACTSDQDCVTGYLCVSGVCAEPGSDAGALDGATGALFDASADAGLSADAAVDTDAGRPDSGAADASTPDAAATNRDAGAADAAAPDSGSALDAGPFTFFPDGGCVQFVSMATDPTSGNPAVAFAQGTDIFFSECASACDTTPVWNPPQLIQANAVKSCAEFSESITLLFLPNAEPAVAYVDDVAASCPVKYAVRSALNVWNPLTVANTGLCGATVHRSSSMASVGDGGIPAIAYHYSNGTDHVGYSVCKTGCDTGLFITWTEQNVASAATNLGHYVSLAVDPSTQMPCIAYGDNLNARLSYATCLVAGGGSCGTATGVWSLGTIDAMGAPEHLSLAFAASGAPSVAYTKAATGTLVLSHCVTGCATGASSTWSAPVTLDGTLAAALVSTTYLQLAVDSQSVPRVAYTNPTTHDLNYIVVSSTGTSTVVDRNITDGHLSFIVEPPGTVFGYSTGPALRFFPTPY